MSDLQLFLLKVFAGSLVVPTLMFVLVRRVRGGERPLAAKITAWVCMYVGQLALPIAGIAVHCMLQGFDWWRRGNYTAAVVYGGVMAIVGAVVGACAMRTFLLGPIVLGTGTETTVADHARRLIRRALVALAVILFVVVVVMRWIPIPGREWMPLIYFAFVIIPLGLTATLVALLGIVLRKPPWQPPVIL